ncbi:MAG TPA: class I SAM-dependent methyltransferase [Campylobacterales bacterium]|nr:class I SAM-dependent methyltransferase [Campylobacterales bacterium]HIP59351.1 class I SAM-dependent methyltransferase [Campylobacterales bacterium]
MKHLDLYAKVESYIGFDEAYEELYQIYLQKLSQYKIDTILDVGCGNGNLLLHLQKVYNAQGIDISHEMIQIAKAKGVDARRISLDKLTQKYDALLAVADVLNYFDADELKQFLEDIEKRLNDGGIFICDINTLFGFEEVTAGSLSIDKENLFIAIDSEFEDNILETKITLFEKEGDCFTKEQAEIVQYYHKIEDIEAMSSLKLLVVEEVALFSDISDKNLLIFQKELL